MVNNLLLLVFVVGNIVVLKFLEIIFLVVDMFVRIFNEVLFNGVLLVIYGDGEVGKVFVVSNINMVVFIGLVVVGKYIMVSLVN